MNGEVKFFENSKKKKKILLGGGVRSGVVRLRGGRSG